MKKLVRNFINWFLNLFRKRYFVSISKEFPDELKNDEIILVGEDNQMDFLTLMCPCGCGRKIQLSLIPKDRPSWKFFIKERDGITISPSIWLTKGCKSHFFIRKSRIIWVK